MKVIFRLFGLISVLGLGFLVTTSSVQAATPQVTNLSTNPSESVPVGKFNKFEVTFQINKTYPADSMLPYYYYDPTDNSIIDALLRKSPRGVDGITINGFFTAPSGKQLAVPAFYFQDYSRGGGIGSDEIMTPTQNFSWKLRFAPEETGSYNYYITITDKEGTSRYPNTGNLSFNVVNSSSKGFIRVSPQDNRFMQFDNGDGFTPIASGHQWWACCGTRSWDYEKAFNDFGSHGINMTRVWDQNDGYALTVEGRFDAYKYPDDFNPENRIDLNTIPKGTQMNQRGNYEEDKMIEAAERNGVYIVLSSHMDPFWIWDDSNNMNYWKRNFRYRVARWGYSTAVLAWERWNEHGHIAVGSNEYNFYQTYSAYQAVTDPWSHLRTTSQGSQAWSPGFWSSSSQDIASYHDYMMPGRYSDGFYNDEVNFVYNFGQCLRMPDPTKNNKCHAGDGSTWSGTDKPIFWGELDVGTANWNEPNPQPIADHNVIWAGLFSPLGTVGIDWYWEQKTNYINQKYDWSKIASDFFKDINYASKKFSYWSTDDVRVSSGLINSSDSRIRVLAMKAVSNQEAYAWVQHKDYTWGKANLTRTAVNGSFVIPYLVDGTYRVTYWNTHTPGAATTSVNVTTSNGQLAIPVTNLTDDVAIKIVSTSTTVTPTVTPVATTPTPTVRPTTIPTGAPTTTAATPTLVPTSAPIVGDGHVKNYGSTVNFDDVKELLVNWLSPVTTILDQYKDNSVNSLDFAVVAYRMLNPPANTPTQAAATSTPIPTQQPPTPTNGPSPTPIPPTSTSEWTQFGHDAQKTNYTSQTVNTPWKYKWQWNGAGADGKPQSGHLEVPDLVQPITGGGRVYIVAGNSVVALDQNSSNKVGGTVLWSKSGMGTMNATPAYDNESVYVAAGNTLQRLKATDGSVLNSFTADSPLNNSPTIYGNNIYIVSNNGTAYSLSKSDLSKSWSSSVGSPAVTTMSYSPGKNLLVFVTQDLFVHGINAGDGTQKWRVKPTVRSYTTADSKNNYTEAANGWPVIAEAHGIVFVRYRIEHEGVWYGSADKGAFAQTNSEIRSSLTANPSKQTVFALDLNNGSTVFVPAIGPGGQGDGDYLDIGPLPVVANMSGKEVAYIPYRNQQTCLQDSWCDGIEDSTMGEMVLDNSTVNGYLAGDVRFVQWNYGSRNDLYHDIQTDEQMQLTMSGNTIYHNHWLSSQGFTITDRSNSKGDKYLNPIQTTPAPNIIWRQVYCAPGDNNCNKAIYPGGGEASIYGPSVCQFNAATRYCTELYAYGDSRSFSSGFYEYHNSYNPNSGSDSYVVVSNGLALVKTNDGAIIALENGSPTSETINNSTIADAGTAKTLPNSVLGESTDSDGIVRDYSEAINYVNRVATFEGVLVSSVNNRPKALYLGFANPHDGSLLIRIFEKYLSKWNYDPENLVGKKIQVKGLVTLYWPENIDPEIEVTDPSQIKIVE